MIAIVKFLNIFIVLGLSENLSHKHFRLKKIIGRGGDSNPRPPEKKLWPIAPKKVVFILAETGRVWYQSIPVTPAECPFSGTKFPQNPGKKLWPKNLAKNSFFAHCAKGDPKTDYRPLRGLREFSLIPSEPPSGEKIHGNGLE